LSTLGLSADPRSRVDALYRAYRQDVYRSLLRDLGNPADADDGTQTVFLSAFRSLDRGCRPHAARAWLLAIAKNVARRTWRERSGAHAELEPDAVPAAAPVDDSRRELVAALEGLPAGQRTALVLHELVGLRYDEISELTEQTVAGVETSVFRARRAVRTAMLADGVLSHDVAAKLLKRFVAGKLTRPERVSLQAHLAGCAECTAAEAKLRSGKARNHVLQWILAVPTAAQRLAAFLQSAPFRGAGAVAVCAVALASAVGDGPADREPATSRAVAGREPVTATSPLSTPREGRRIAAAPHVGTSASAPAQRRPKPSRARAADHAMASQAEPRAPRRGRGGAVAVSTPEPPSSPRVPDGQTGRPAPGEAPAIAHPAAPATPVSIVPPSTALDPALPVLGGVLDGAGATTGDVLGTTGQVAGAVTDTAGTTAGAVTDLVGTVAPAVIDTVGNTAPAVTDPLGKAVASVPPPAVPPILAPGP
jgi:RNA polymerase sigma-70 factor (ECF subfamily)